MESPGFAFCLFGAVWSFVSASLGMSAPLSMLKMVSSVSVSVSAPPCPLTLGYCRTDFCETVLLCSGTRLKCNSNTGVSDWLFMGQVLPVVQSAVVQSQEWALRLTPAEGGRGHYQSTGWAAVPQTGLL